MANTPNLNLILPIPGPGGTPGPTWASEVNTNFSTIDTHDHSSGSGVKIPTAALNLNADVAFNSFNLNTIRAARFDDQVAELTNGNDTRIIYVKNGELVYRDAAAQEVQLTNGGSVAGATGTITGLVSPASASYSNISKSFTFNQDTSKPGKLNISDILLYEFDNASALTTTIKSAAGLAAPTTITMSDRSGTLGTDFGAVPIGTVVPVFDNSVFAGGVVLPATTVVQNGWMLCDGATVPAGHDATGATTPDLTDDRFIMGDTAASLSPAGSNSSAHTHTITHTHTIAHTHNISHNHQALFKGSTGGLFGGTLDGGGENIASFTDVSNGTLVASLRTNVGAAGGITLLERVTSSETLYTAGVRNAPTGANGSAASSGASSAANSGGSSAANSGGASSSNNRPQYLSAVYLIRVS